jgi:N-methylhydantoinase A
MVGDYVRRLEHEIRAAGIGGSFQIMQSNGGVMSAAAAAQKAIYSVESDPAAGVIAAAHLGRLLGHPDIVSFDMGGTTAKAGLIRDGKPASPMTSVSAAGSLREDAAPERRSRFP